MSTRPGIGEPKVAILGTEAESVLSSVMSLLDKLEPKLGRFALPGILKIVAAFQVLVYFLVAYTTKGQGLGDSSFYHLLTLDREAIFSGQIWRVFSFMFLPINENPLWVLIHAWFLSFINRALEEEWGSFKLNVYVFSGMLFVALGVIVFGGWPTGSFLFSTFILAAAMLHPNFQIMLFLIIPVKLKWVGLMTIAWQVLIFLGPPPGTDPMAMRITIFLSLLNFVLFFGPSTLKSMRDKSETTTRRKKFEKAQSIDGEAFSTCTSCGKTDVDDPEEDFRVTADGEEYCSDCRMKPSSS